MAGAGGWFNSDEVLYQFNTSSTVYTAVWEILEQRERWRATSGAARYNLMLGERWNVAKLYPMLGQDGARHVVNHYRGTKDITMKALMVRTLRRYAEETGTPLASLITDTYLLVPGEDHDEERFLFEDAMRSQPGSVWILKCTDAAHGSGIMVSDDICEIYTYVDGFAKNKGVKPERGETLAEAAARAKRHRPSMWLAQRYVERPLLFNGRKFDVRALVVVTHDYKALWYKNWILRLCSEPYSMDNLKDPIVHITNHCVQTGAERYGTQEEGNELFTRDFEWYLMHKVGVRKGKELLRGLELQMQSTVRHSLEAIRDNTEAPTNYKSFQVLGYDFIFDDEYNAKLLEVNGSPACATRMLEEFARDLVEAAIDPIFGVDAGEGFAVFAPHEPGGRITGESPFEEIPWNPPPGAHLYYGKTQAQILASDYGEAAGAVPTGEGIRLHTWDDQKRVQIANGGRTGPKKEPDAILDKPPNPYTLGGVMRAREAEADAARSVAARCPSQMPLPAAKTRGHLPARELKILQCFSHFLQFC